MNSKSLQYNNAGNTKLETLASRQISLLATIIRKVSSYLVRSDIEVAQARYETRRQQGAKSQSQQDIVGNLPLEEKHRLGMYHFMN